MTFTQPINYHYKNAMKQMVELKTKEGLWARSRTLPLNKALMQGFAVEAAWAQYNNAPYEYRPYVDGIDDVLGYQLRGTQHLDGNLVTYDDDPNAIYIFGTVNENCDVVTFVGWSTKKRANIPSHYKTHWPSGQKMHRPAFVTSQQELWPFDVMPLTKELAAHRGI
jgi:hypothetical protein